MREYHLIEIEDAPELDNLREAWIDISGKSGGTAIFQSFDWNRAWLNSVGRRKGVRIHFVFDGEEISCIMPVFTHRSRHQAIPARVIRLVGFPDSDYSDIILREGSESALSYWAEHLENSEIRWDVMQFDEIIWESTAIRSLGDAFAERGYNVSTMPTGVCPFIELSGSYEEYLTSMKRNNRKVLRKKERRLNERGEVSFARYGGEREKLPELLDTAVMLEKMSWKGDRRIGLFTDEEQISFHQEFLLSETGRNHADLVFLLLDERPIAYQYAFKWDHVYYAYNTAFDPEFSDLSPGNILMNQLIRECHHSGRYTILDLMRGGEEYKFMWTDKVSWNRRIVIYNKTLYGRMLFLAAKARERVEKIRQRVLRQGTSKSAWDVSWSQNDGVT